MLSKTAILSAPFRYEDIDAPAWGGTVRLRVLSGRALTDYEAQVANDAPLLERCARIIAFCAVDEEGNRLFSDDDIPALLERDARTLVLLGTAATRINALRVEDLAEAEKKSVPSPS